MIDDETQAPELHWTMTSNDVLRYPKIIVRRKPARPCQFCGTEFRPFLSTGKFCSNRCRIKHHRAKTKEGEKGGEK